MPTTKPPDEPTESSAPEEDDPMQVDEDEEEVSPLLTQTRSGTTHPGMPNRLRTLAENRPIDEAFIPNWNG